MTVRRTDVLVWAVALGVVLAGESGAAGAGRGRKLPPDARIPRVKATVTAARGRLPSVVGTLQYDNNVPFRRDPATDNVIGNQFLGADPHSIASVSFRVAQNYSSGVIVSAWNPDGMGGATRLFQQYVSGIPNGATMSVTMFTAMAPLTMALTGLNGPFIAGVHNTAFTGNGCPGNSMLNGTCDGVAVTAGTMDPGQGFHAFRIPLVGGTFIPPTTMVAGGVAPIAGINAIFRVTGDNLPVELMELSVR